MSVAIEIKGDNCKSSIIHKSDNANISSESSENINKFGVGIWQVFLLDAKDNALRVPERNMYLKYDYVDGIPQKLIGAADSKIGNQVGDGSNLTTKGVILEYFKTEKLWNLMKTPGHYQKVPLGKKMPDGTYAKGFINASGEMVEEFVSSYLTEYDTEQTISMSVPIPSSENPTPVEFKFKEVKCNFTKHYDVLLVKLISMNEEARPLLSVILGVDYDSSVGDWIQFTQSNSAPKITSELVQITNNDLKFYPYLLPY